MAARVAELVQLLSTWVAEEPARQTAQPDLYRLSAWVAAGQSMWRSLPLRHLKPLQMLLQSEAFSDATLAELEAAPARRAPQKWPQRRALAEEVLGTSQRSDCADARAQEPAEGEALR